MKNLFPDGLFTDDLDQINREFQFRFNEPKLAHYGSTGIMVSWHETSSDRTKNALFTLSRGLIPPDEVQQVVCGVIDDHGDVAAARRSNAQGQFAAALTEGTYSLRFVTDTTNHQDVEILSTLADDDAIWFLEQRLEEQCTSEKLKDSIRRALRVHESKRQAELDLIDLILSDKLDDKLDDKIRLNRFLDESMIFRSGHSSATISMKTASVSSDDLERKVSKANEAPIWIDTGRVMISCDAEKIPYRIGLLVIKEASNETSWRTLERKLCEVKKRTIGDREVCFTPVGIPIKSMGKEVQKVEAYFIPFTIGNCASFHRFGEELELLLSKLDDEEIKESIQRILKESSDD